MRRASSGLVKLRRWTPMIVFAILASPIVVSTSAAESNPIHLATFHPGAPDEPAWTMLKLDVEREDAEIFVSIQFTQMRCPMAWAFVFFQGPPEEARSIGSVTFDFAHGQQGAIVYTGDEMPVTFHRSTIDDDGARSCPTIPGFGLQFKDLPRGEVYLLQYTAGTPFHSIAEVNAPRGGIRVVDATSGERTFYVNSTGFSSGPMRAGVHSPGVHVSANRESSGSLWNPDSYWAGDSLAGADVSMGRGVSLHFEDQPYYRFWVPRTLSVTESSITDPHGRVWRDDEMALAHAADVSINGQGFRSQGVISQYPSGTYAFEIQKSVAVGVQYGVPWHIHAADYRFPGGR